MIHLWIRRIFLCVVAVGLFAVLFVPVYGAGLTVKLNAPKQLRAGESFALTVVVNGSGLASVQGTLYYDNTLLRYLGSGDAPDGWSVEADGSKSGAVSLLAYDNALKKPINGAKQLCTLRFQVRADTADGSQLEITSVSFYASDGETDFYAANTSCKSTIVPPLSGDCSLERLTIQDVSLSPAFSAEVTRYSATVPFSMKRLTIQAYAKNAKAKVTVQGQALSVGTNTVTIRVQAENGDVKVYTITAERQQDPDYQPSSNAHLRAITASAGALSPQFSPDIMAYTLTLPKGTSSVLLKGSTQENTATCKDVKATDITESETVLQLNVTAEDGTKLVYSVTVQMIAVESSSQGTSGSAGESQIETIAPATEAAQKRSENPEAPLWLLLLTAVVCFAAGAATGYLVMRERKERNSTVPAGKDR